VIQSEQPDFAQPVTVAFLNTTLHSHSGPETASAIVFKTTFFIVVHKIVSYCLEQFTRSML
jgi:hypothetical protein